MKKQKITELEKTQIAYDYFSLDDWKDIANSVMANTSLQPEVRFVLLSRMPSAAVPTGNHLFRS